MTVQNADKQILSVFITERAPIAHYCDHCKQTVEWTPWRSSTALPTGGAGHYALQNNITLSKQLSAQADCELIFDLNGHTITNSGGVRVISLHNFNSYIAIMDYSEAQTGKVVSGTATVDQGGCVWARYGTFELFSGTLDASGSTTYKSGAAVDIVPDSVFNMYGGTIIGGTSAVSDTDTNGNGGSVNVRGIFNMYGGTIKGGIAQQLGGNVYVASSGTFNMYDGTIEGGTANTGTEAITGTMEANVYVNESVFNKTGGTIEGETGAAEEAG